MFQQALDEINKLRARISKYRDQLMKNELLTRYILIDPFLRLLGWDTEDPEQVRPEFSTQAGRPDYALLHGSERPIAFIGAKSLGRQEDLQQYISYCVSEGVKYFITTDGARWEVYDTFIPKPLAEKKIAEWDISREEPGEVLRKALIILRHAPFTAEAQKPITLPERKEVVEKIGDPLSLIKPKPGSKMTYREILFPDGKRYTIKKWRDILRRTVEWLVETNRLTRDKLPIRAGRKRYIVNDRPIHQSGVSFRSPKVISGFYVECGVDIILTLRHTKRLLEFFGVNASDVYLV